MRSERSLLLYFGLIVLLALTGCEQRQAIDQPVEAASTPPPNAVATTVPLDAAAARPARPSPSNNQEPERVLQIPAGSAFVVRLNQSIDTRTARPGDRFSANLDAPILVGEASIVPVGTPVTGHIVAAKSSGRLKGRGNLMITLDSFHLNGKTYAIATSSDSWTTGAHKKRNFALIGGGSGVGALIGGLASGGSGALIGAGAGAAAGTGGAALTGKKNIHLSSETRVRFTLKAPVRIQG